VTDLLLEATRIRLRADVPVGAYVSGGLDSSGLTALVAKQFNNQLDTFGIRFEETGFDEGEYQSQVVDLLQTNHHEACIKNAHIHEVFDRVVWHSERPLLRTSPVPLYLLSSVVRNNGLKVVLTGEGADEVFGGYNIFKETKIRRFWSRDPDSSSRHRLLQQLYPYVFTDPRSACALQFFFRRYLTETEDNFYSHRLRWDSTSNNYFYFSDNFLEQLGGYNPLDDLRDHLPGDFSSRDSFSKTQYLEMKIFMSNYLLSSQGDRVAMAHSVEIRLPYLDHRLIEFMARVPAKWKIRGLNEKYILKSVFRPLLPDEILQRKKTPYRAPIRQGLRLEESVFDDDFFSQEMVFNRQNLQILREKLERTSNPSEVDDMGLTGILSTYFFHKNFLESTVQSPVNNRIRTIIDKRKLRKQRTSDQESLQPGV
ncbi:MAG TPA: asparagine synthase C-terminal domain-containing protein, partial [bacterium]|nr:asparagine synthase C-terminal domain-containing protein [bacterium]